MVKKKDSDFPKRNELATLKGNNLSIYAHKTFDYIYKAGLKYYEDKRDGGIFTLNIYELKEVIGMKDTRHENIIKELEAIRKVDFECYDTKYYSKFPLLAGFELKSNGVLEVALSPFLIRMIFDEKSPYYHMSNILDYKELRSKYSKRILDLIKRYNYKIPKMDIEKFKDLMQYGDKYKSNDIKRFVLEQAQKELLEYNDIEFTWEFVKQGAKLREIKLFAKYISKNDKLKNAEVVEPTERSEKLQKAIDKARKNRFIDSKYSEKFMRRLIDKYDEKDIIKALNEAYTYNKEIKTFYGFMKAAIEDIISSKKQIPEGLQNKEIPTQKQQKKIKVTQEEFEGIKRDYLIKAGITGDNIPPMIKRGLDGHLKQYEIITDQKEMDFDAFLKKIENADEKTKALVKAILATL